MTDKLQKNTISGERINASVSNKPEDITPAENTGKSETNANSEECCGSQPMSEKSPPPSPISRDERLRKIREEHLKEIRDQVEEAKNPASYESYDGTVSQADGRIKLFIARRKGNSHVKSKTPCQDYCLATSVNGCTVLADADGVGSCEHADIGSQLACEAVVLAVKAATESCGGEDEIVRRLLTVSFRNRLVNIWKTSVLKTIGNAGGLLPGNWLKEFGKYGSTIMFAVMTENWIVVGNLGDGQVLVFNDHCGIKLRVHGPKYSSKVRCLLNERCAREDFLVAKYPRNSFNGVLLSTDGIYESFDQGNIFFSFCKQAKERFLARIPCEPYQAFCYQENGEPYKDFSRMRSEDDCSLAMAIDERKVESNYETVIASILQHAPDAVLKHWRWSQECMSFYLQNDVGAANVVVSRKISAIALPEKLKTAVLETPTETWREGDLLFSKYADDNLSTIELMRCDGMLRRDRHNPTESGQRILKVYLQLRNLQNELSELGLELNSSALFNIAFDGNLLHLRKEALKSISPGQPKMDLAGIADCFSHLLGILESGGRQSPLFDIGYLDKGCKHYRFADSPEELAQLVWKNKKTHLANISPYSWKCNDGHLLSSGESVELSKKMTFTLLGNQEEELESYNYIPKELL